MKKRRLAIGAIVLVVALIVVRAVSGGEGTADQAPSGSAKGMVVAVTGDPPGGLDPAANQLLGWTISKNVYSYLVTAGVNEADGVYDPSDIICDACESYEVAPDNKKITFTLRKDIVFDSGNRMTAEDVRWSFERGWRVPGYARTQFAAGAILHPRQFKVRGDDVFEINFPKGINRFTLENLETPHFPIYDSATVKENATPDDKWGSEYLRTHAPGSGPYRLESWRPGESIRLTKREDYYGDVQPEVDQVTYQIIPDEQTRFQLLRSGSVDMVFELSGKKLAELEGDDRVTVQRAPAAQDVFVLRMNPDEPPFDDIRVRRAVMQAIPYDTLIEETLHGFGEPNPDICGRTTLGFEPQEQYRYDIEQAKAELAAAGGAPGSVEIVVPAENQQVIDGMVYIQAALKRLGIDLKVRKVTQSAYEERTTKRDVGPLNSHAMGPWINDCMYWTYWMFTKDSITNYIGLDRPALETLTSQAMSELDDEKYIELVEQVRDILIDEVIVVPLYLRNVTMAHRSDVSGVVAWPWSARGGGIEFKYVKVDA